MDSCLPSSLSDYQQRSLYFNGNLFPFDSLFRMLTLNINENYRQKKAAKQQRVLSMTEEGDLEGIDDADTTSQQQAIVSPGTFRVIGLQYDSNPFQAHDFPRYSEASFKATTIKKNPFALHMGMHQSDANFARLIQTHKELVFDLDITDYTRFCPCHPAKSLCPGCCPYITGSYMILKFILHKLLGFSERNLLWVFSGGKGIHCFVNAQTALTLGKEERLALCRRWIIKKGEDLKLMQFIKSLDDNKAFLQEIVDFFTENLIKKRNLFQYAAFESFCLGLLKLHYNNIASLVENSWQRIEEGQREQRCKQAKLGDGSATPDDVSAKKWRSISGLEKLPACLSGGAKDLPLPSQLIAFKLLYPQIDPGPLAIDHLIKLPFSIHSTSYNIALPIDGRTLLNWDPARDFLSLTQLLEKPNHPLFAKGLVLLDNWVAAYPK